ncbi:snapalysin family zinc-dependent metalloprotease [Amycolatopsis acidiphila]|uniref:Extracellular small neutral protease n=1 Tax=Amycolatopsis acidiphila TaxID=715473 RepID=A0A558A3Y0_9PSEU|nr:snapalysin family zinc-dependent metalloprotease [Amycolatopsis acidiphila]TVT18965.1 snapalysin family zinc-dependent metalloprotease [Amycolatopsis acidiphila]UIJ63911.1 snapalysin family zinc-dependent metalloprotease [Amycolatopsis acidiphila]
MLGRRVLVGALAVALPFGVQLGLGASADAAGVTTLYYSSAGAPDYLTQIDQAATNWNAAVSDVRLVKGGSATIVFHETDDGQGSYTSTDGHGHGQVYIDRQQVEEGFAPTRIAAHELGHNLGLPDDYTGPCSEIMSGHGPGTSCTNAVPDAAEAAQVQQNWVNGFAAAGPERAAR